MGLVLNKPRGQRFEINGESLTLRQWSEQTGISLGTLKSRVRMGIMDEELIAPSKRPPVKVRPGQKFARWMVVRLLRPNKGSQKGRVLVRCACGTEKDVDVNCLLHGGTQSCGCWRREYCGKLSKKYEGGNVKDTPLYRIWSEIKMRCHSPNYAAYEDFGAKGIEVCLEWRWDFDAFRRDMGPKPEVKYLNRIDPRGPYSAKNCRWGDTPDRVEAVYADIDGIRLKLIEWARHSGVPTRVIWDRIKKSGWSAKNAIFTPVGNVPGDYDVREACEILKNLRGANQ